MSGLETELKNQHVAMPHTERAVSYVIACVLACVCICTALLYAGIIANQPPMPFPVETTITIETGSTVNDIATTLSHAGAIRSVKLFKLLVALDGRSSALKAGSYRFTEPLTTAEVMRAIINGTHAETDVIVTIPEGTRASESARIVHEALPELSQTTLENLMVLREGYLFPDTYHLSPRMTEEDVVALFAKTFEERMPNVPEGNAHTPHDIVTMASILEREGNSSESMALIAGILWKRLEIDMPLQVDATLEYERGKGSAELSLADLEEDSPYNTYTRRGLPPTPISNPGTVALMAALAPEPSPYLYYLTGTDGAFYYASTFEEHKRNKERYLR